MPDEHLDLRPDHEAEVRRILRKHVPDREVWVFGSRATGRAKPYSDLDLAILGDAPLPPATRIALTDAFDESDLPFQVDLVEWATIGEDFRRIVREAHMPLQEPGTASTGPRRSASGLEPA